MSQKPSLKYSQNFLTSPDLVRELINKSSLGQDDFVYEIGPGKGIITQELAKACKKVVAIEKDKNLYQRLCQKFASQENVEIVQGDFLKTTLPKKEPYKIFSNIPFALTADIIKKLTQTKNPPTFTN